MNALIPATPRAQRSGLIAALPQARRRRANKPSKAPARAQPKPKKTSNRQRTPQRKQDSSFWRACMIQLDRLLNPRTHLGEVQPRSGQLPSVTNSIEKTIVNVAGVVNQYYAVVMCSGANQGIITASSASASTNFADSAVSTGANSYSTTVMQKIAYAAGVISVSVGSPALDAGGFVTYGSISGEWTKTTAAFNQLDPGDLINVPGAVTVPLWKFMNDPYSGYMRKISAAADSFEDTTALDLNADQITVPFLLFNIPSALTGSFALCIQEYKSFDFIPTIADTSIPSITRQPTLEEVGAYRWAQHHVGMVASGFVRGLAAGASRGEFASTFVNTLNDNVRFEGGRNGGSLTAALTRSMWD